MDLTPKNKAIIDNMPYERLLSDWRFAPVGNAWFQGETGNYWSNRMKELRDAGADHVGASKSIDREKGI
jgi:hypothetical protein